MCALTEARRADVLLLPGAYLTSVDAMRTWLAGDEQRRWRDLVRRFAADKKHVAASCAGTWLLGEAGVLDGRQATTVWWLAPAFRQRYPNVSVDLHALLVDDANVTTAGAAFAHIDLVLHLVARWADATLAERCARLLLAPTRDVQSRHVSLSFMSQSDPLMRRLCRWIDQHLAQPIDVETLARAMHLTSRTLARRCRRTLGLSPWRVVQRQRVEAARQLLHTTTLPFEKIAARVGYADGSALRRLMKREFGAPDDRR